MLRSSSRVGGSRSTGNGVQQGAADLELSALPPCDRTKNKVTCLNSRIRVHCVVSWQCGQVRTSPGAKVLLLGPVAKDKEQHDTSVGESQQGGVGAARTTRRLEMTLGSVSGEVAVHWWWQPAVQQSHDDDGVETPRRCRSWPNFWRHTGIWRDAD